MHAIHKLDLSISKNEIKHLKIFCSWKFSELNTVH